MNESCIIKTNNGEYCLCHEGTKQILNIHDALIVAADFGDINIIKDIMTLKKDIVPKYSLNGALLLSTHNLEIFEYLHKHGAEIDNLLHYQTFCHAIENNNFDMVKYLCELDVEYDKGEMFIFAVDNAGGNLDIEGNNDWRIVKYLCEYWINDTEESMEFMHYDYNTIIEAVIPSNIEMAKYFVDLVISKCRHDDIDCCSGNLSCVEDANQFCIVDILCRAILHNCLEIVKYTIESLKKWYNKHISIVEKENQTLPVSFWNRYSYIPTYPLYCYYDFFGDKDEDFETIKYMCEQGIDIHGNHDILLCLAIVNKNIPIIKLLLQYGATPPLSTNEIEYNCWLIDMFVNPPMSQQIYHEIIQYCKLYSKLLKKYMEKAIEVNCNIRLSDINLSNKIINNIRC